MIRRGRHRPPSSYASRPPAGPADPPPAPVLLVDRRAAQRRAGTTSESALAAAARIGELVTAYADLRPGGTDASLVALAERHGVSTIATLNRRDFTIVRPRHVDPFELLP